MAFYYFDLRDSETLRDPSGVELATDQDAIAHARDLARQIAIDPPGSTPIHFVTIYRLNGGEVARVPVRRRPLLRSVE